MLTRSMVRSLTESVEERYQDCWQTLELLAEGKHDVHKLVVASSMSIYGEGKYICSEHGAVYPQLRSEE